MGRNRFITCGHCGAEVELRTPYVTMCPSCYKKLTNSYTAWQQTHDGADRPYEDYLREVAHERDLDVVVAQTREKDECTVLPDSENSQLQTMKIVCIVANVLLFVLTFAMLDHRHFMLMPDEMSFGGMSGIGQAIATVFTCVAIVLSWGVPGLYMSVKAQHTRFLYAIFGFTLLVMAIVAVIVSRNTM